MNDLVPGDGRIDRSALERIIQRAAELQAGEREIGEGLTEAELLQLGRDVGIPAPYLQQALVEERTRAVTMPERGIAARLAGPRYVGAQRTLAGTPSDLEEQIRHWMTESELLVIKRRHPGRTTWEAKRGTVASLKRSLGGGGRRYLLARADEVASAVIPVDDARSHVQLLADLGNTRRERLGGAATLAVLGAGATGIGLALGVMELVAVVPAGVGILGGAAVARGRYGEVERMQVALEQILDRLEHGEIRIPRTTHADTESPLVRIADEFRRTFGI